MVLFCVEYANLRPRSNSSAVATPTQKQLRAVKEDDGVDARKSSGDSGPGDVHIMQQSEQ